MTKTLSYAGVAIGALIVILLFVTSKSYTQLGIAVILYPIFAYLTLKLVPRQAEVYVVNNTSQIPQTPNIQANVTIPGKVDIVDIEKRTFLKLVGTAGLSFFLFSLLGRKAEDLIFDKQANTQNQLPPTTNTNLESGETKATISDEYKISEVDDGAISYYGFVNKSGGWLIMKEDTIGSSFRYSKGNDNFSKNWTDRDKLKYDYYDNLF